MLTELRRLTLMVYMQGDCTGRPYQYAKAVGEGNVAVHSVLDYLKNIKIISLTGDD